MLIRSTVVEAVNGEIRDLLGDALDEDDNLSGFETFQEIGLNSLMLARLLIALEAHFDVDPFESDLSVLDVHTIEDLWDAYEHALSRTTAGSA